MAIIDIQNTFAETLDLGAAAAGSTTAATNVYDTGSEIGRDLGMNYAQHVIFEFTCKETFDEAMAGAALEIQIVSGAAAPVTPGDPILTPNVHWTSGALDPTLLSATFPLVEGQRMLVPFPVDGGLNPEILRYIGVHFLVTAQALSAGMFDISMARGYHKDKLFAWGWNFA